VAQREAQANAPEVSSAESGGEASDAATGGGAAEGATVNGVAVPAFLLERAKAARTRLGG
jgi:hypothetical protein